MHLSYGSTLYESWTSEKDVVRVIEKLPAIDPPPRIQRRNRLRIASRNKPKSVEVDSVSTIAKALPHGYAGKYSALFRNLAVSTDVRTLLSKSPIDLPPISHPLITGVSQF
jgi:hypothetical protein